MGQIAKAISSGAESRLHGTIGKAEVWGQWFQRFKLFAILPILVMLLMAPLNRAHADPDLPGGDYHCQAENYFNRLEQLCVEGERPLPVADAGQDQAVQGGATVVLHGAASNTLGESVVYRWNFESSNAPLPNGLFNALQSAFAWSDEAPSFSAPILQPGDPDLELTVSLVVSVTGFGSDADFVDSVPDTVVIVVKAPGNEPAKPVVTSVAPNTSPQLGGTFVKVFGSGFSSGANLLVKFGNKPAEYSITSDSEMMVVAPAGPVEGGTVDVTVQVDDTISDVTDADRFTYAAALIPQTITYTSQPSPYSFVGEEYQVTAQGGASGAEVQFSSATPAVCALSSETVSFLSEGLCTIVASQTGDASHEAAPDVEQTFAVHAAVVVSAGQAKTVASGSVVELSALSQNLPEGAEIRHEWTQVEGPVVSLEFDVQDAYIQKSPHFTAPALLPGGPNVDLKFTVSALIGTSAFTSAPVTVTVEAPLEAPIISSISPPKTAVTGGTDITITGTALSDAEVTMDGVPVQIAQGATATSIKFKAPAHAAGSAIIAVTTPGGSASADFTYAHVPQSITLAASPDSLVYLGTSSVLASGQSGTGPVSYSVPDGNGVCTIKGSNVTAIGVGVCTVTATVVADDIYSLASATFDISVYQAKQTIAVSAAPAAIVFGGQATLSATRGAGSGALSYQVTEGSDICSLEGSTLTGTGLGVCTITATQLADTNYKAATATTTIVVNAPALQTSLDQAYAEVTFVAGSPIAAFTPVVATGGYGSKSFKISPPLPDGLSLNTAAGEISGTPGVAAAASIYTVTAKDSAPQTQSSSQTFTLTVLPRPETTISSVLPATGATIGGETITISGANFTGATEVSIGGVAVPSFKVMSDATISAKTPLHGAGKVGILVKTPLGTATTSGAFTYVLTPQIIMLTSTVPSAALVGGSYGVSATASSLLPVVFSSGDSTVCSVEGGVVDFVGVGTCIINANQPGDGTYAAAAEVQQSFTVKQPLPLPTITQISPAFGIVSGNDTVTIFGTNLAGGTVTFGGKAATPLPNGVGANSITVTTPEGSLGATDVAITTPGGEATAAYAFTYKNGQSVTFSSSAPLNAMVGGTYEVAAVASSGLAITFTSGSTDVCDVAGASVSLKEEGTCRIYANQLGNQSYLAAPQRAQEFAVAAPPELALPSIDAISPDEGKTVGGEVVAIQGVNLDQLVSVMLDGKPVTVDQAKSNALKITFATPNHVAGLASLVVTTQSGEATAKFNYVKTQQVISFASPTDTVFGQTPPVLNATATSGLDVVFASATTDVCTVDNSGEDLKLLSVGECQIEAKQEGNDIYEQAQSVTRTFNVVPPPREITNAKPLVNAGEDRVVYSGESFQFSDATASDSDHDALTYQWQLVGDAVAGLSQQNSLVAKFSAPHRDPGSDDLVLTFKLTVSDGKDSVSDTVDVTVRARSKTGTGDLSVATSPQGGVPAGIVTLTFVYSPMVDHASLGSLTMFGAVSPVVGYVELAVANSGGVTFYDGSVVLCADVALVNNKATCNVNLAPGPHNLRAVYNNGEVSVEPVSDTILVTAVDQAGPTATAIGGFLSDRANLIVSNLPDMARQIDRLNEAQAAQGGASPSSNFGASGKSDLWASEKGDLLLSSDKGDLMLNSSRLGGGPSGASITASRLGVASGTELGTTSVGQQDMLGFQSFLYNYLRSSGETGNFGHFNFSGPMDMEANFSSTGGQASFKTSLSQIVGWQQQREQKEMAALGFGASGAGKYFMPLDVWMEGIYSSYSGKRDGAFGMATIGADYVFNPSFLAGFYGQFDKMNQNTATKVDGSGWMIGPYATLRLGENVFWQGRAGFGKSANTISPDGDYSDTFGTTRWLVSSSLAGQWKMGKALAFAPTASFAYFEDKSDGYVDHYGVEIPAVKTNLGQIKLSPALSYGFLTDSDLWIEPSVATELIWNFASTDVDGLDSLDGDATGPAGLRGRIKAGLNIRTPSGIYFGAFGTYDGIGSAGYSAISGQATVSVPLN